MDSGATAHLTTDPGNLSTLLPSSLTTSRQIVIGDVTRLPVISSGHASLSSCHKPLHLNNILISPQIIKNLISIHQFTRDNQCSVEFDPFGLSVKDLRTRNVIL